MACSLMVTPSVKQTLINLRHAPAALGGGDKAAMDLMLAYAELSETGKDPQFTDEQYFARALFDGQKAHILSMRENYLRRAETARKNGAKGGRPRTEASAEEYECEEAGGGAANKTPPNVDAASADKERRFADRARRDATLFVSVQEFCNRAQFDLWVKDYAEFNIRKGLFSKNAKEFFLNVESGIKGGYFSRKFGELQQ